MIYNMMLISSVANLYGFVGTVVDNKICHPRNYDFYMCAHAGMIVSIFSLF